MAKERTHAEILSDIAKQVVRTNRMLAQVQADRLNKKPAPEPATPSHDPSWDYALPERFRG